MADEADIANDAVEKWANQQIAMTRAEIPKGIPGECSKCGKEFHRLVNGACPPCRDKYNLG